MESGRIKASFRDPSGYVFADGGRIKRAIHPIYFKQYDALVQSGLYDFLIRKKALIRHSEITRSPEQIVLESQKIPLVSYPYEWSFLQYKHAALLTLQIQKDCLKYGFTLKDASAFNVTFFEGRPVFIDTLSFDFYQEDAPWNAYKQFIMHFLGPLVMSHYYGLDHLKSLAWHIDGIPLKMLSRQLPFKSRLSPTLLSNIHLLAKFDARYSEGSGSAKTQKLSRASQVKLLDSLYDYIKNLKARETTEWGDYYNQTNYNDASFVRKKELTLQWFKAIGGKRLLDVGGNDGTFSRILRDDAQLLVVADIDANAVEQNYREVIREKSENLLPLVADFMNPPADSGFNNEERTSLLSRLKALQLDGCLALAVIHHLTLSGNVPFAMSARFFAQLAPHLLIEFPTRNDSWVQFLLDGKREFKSHFDFYSESGFEQAYSEYFDIVRKDPIAGSERILYTMKTKYPQT